MQKALTLFDTTIGKKAVMAVSGLVLFGFVIGHMLGNLQVFLGPEKLNGYAEKLHSLGGLLWVVRLVLLVTVLAHIVTSVQLYQRSWAARPVRYRVQKSQATSYAAKSMWLSGPVILLFVAYHLAHFTLGIPVGSEYQAGTEHVYDNVVAGFQVPWITGLYVLAQVFLGLHLFHGSWSLFQTVGFNHPRYNDKTKLAAQALAAFVTVGNVLIPLAVLAGLVG